MIESVMGRGVVNIQDLIDDANCYRKVRELRWPEGVRCPFCGDEHRLKHGFDSTHLYFFMGLNLSNSQIARELGLNKCDEVYIVAGHIRAAIRRKKNAAKDDATASKRHADAAHWRRRNPRSSA